MEPAVERREHGSQVLGPLTCEDPRLCERFGREAVSFSHNGVVKVREPWLTWARALPGVGLITGALASHDHGRCRRQFLMLAKEQEAGRVADTAEMYHHD